MKSFPFGVLIVTTVVGGAMGSLQGPCCGAWREIARAEGVIVCAGIGLSLGMSTWVLFALTRKPFEWRFRTTRVIEIVAVVAIMCCYGRTYVQRVQYSQRFPMMGYDGGPLSEWMQERVRSLTPNVKPSREYEEFLRRFRSSVATSQQNPTGPSDSRETSGQSVLKSESTPGPR